VNLLVRRGATWPRRIALLVMVGVTGWSVWALGQPRKPGPGALPQTPQMARRAVPRPPAPAAEPAEDKKEEDVSAQPGPFNFGQFGEETPPYLAMLINFGILVGGYYLLGKDGIAAGLKSRRETIQREIEEAARMKAEAEERAKKYQARLARVEQEMESAREALVRAGEAERDRIIKEAEAKAERMRKDAEFLVEQELKQIRIDLLREAVDQAVLAAGELLKKRVTPADQERLADEYLADLGTKKTLVAGGAS
jgi:F0F1-type ATP synthase membrane subunit b/b'